MSVEMKVKLTQAQSGNLYMKSLDQEKQIKELQDQLDKYKRLAKERGDFIINGEELGYISVPESEIDSAYYTFLRCQMTDEAAAEAV